MTEQPTQRLERYADGRIVFLDRDEPRRGHAFARTECVDLAEGVRRMGYAPEPAQPAEPKKRSWIAAWFEAVR